MALAIILQWLHILGNSLDEVSPSYFDINENGTLKLNTVDKAFVKNMHKENIKVVPFLSNHWDRAIGRAALSNREALATSITNAIIEYDLDGVNIDIENVTEVDKDTYTDLVKILRSKLPAEKEVVVSVAANPYNYKTGWHGSYDYQKLGENADYLMIMAYDEHYEGGEEGAVAGIKFVEESIKYALKYVNKSKIVIGLPLYGRYWKQGTSYGGRAASLTQIEDLIKNYESVVTYDEENQTAKAQISIMNTDVKPKLYGHTLTMGRYDFYYENEKSIAAKLDLVNKYDIKGVGSWKIGMEQQSLWDIFKEKLSEGMQIFYDVPNSHWAKNEIEFMKNKNLIIGKFDNMYEPENSLTRAEMATITSRLIKEYEIIEPSNLNTNIEFKDISGHWAEKEINEIAKLGIVEGYYDKSFRPNESITRSEIAKIVSKLLDIVEEKNTDETKRQEFKNYQDVGENNWAYEYIKDLSERGILTGYPDNTFRPNINVTRAEIAKILYNFLTDKF